MQYAFLGPFLGHLTTLVDKDDAYMKTAEKVITFHIGQYKVITNHIHTGITCKIVYFFVNVSKFNSTNSKPHTLYTSKGIFKRKGGKKKTWLHDQENIAQTHWQDDIIQEKKNIQETILLQPFIEKIYTIESSES